MAFSSTSITQAGRAGSRKGSTVVEGLDVIVRDFTREANTIRPKSEKVVVDYAAKAADRMRSLVAIDEGDTLDSIDSDRKATTDGSTVYADAGPWWFVARFLEHGTVDTAPQPFVGPAADQIVGPFANAIKGLPDL